MFARSRSSSYFNRTKILLGVEDKEALGHVLTSFAQNPNLFPRWHFHSFNPATLLGFDVLASDR